MKGEKFTYQGLGIRKRVTNAVSRHGTAGGVDALLPKEPTGSQHVVTVADQDGITEADLVEYAPTEYCVFFGAAAMFFHQDGACWYARGE